MKEWSQQFVDDWLRLNPISATELGVHDYDDEWGNIGIIGASTMNEFITQKASELQHFDPTLLSVRITSLFFEDIQRTFRAGDYLYDLNSLQCTFHNLVSALNHTRPESKTSRLQKLPLALTQYIELLREGLRRGKIVTRRQVLTVIEQASDLPLFSEFRQFLQVEYLPQAVLRDGVGSDRYMRAVKSFTGTELNLIELYEWGFQEINRVQAELDSFDTVEQVSPLVHTEEEFFNFINTSEADAWERVQDLFHIPDVIQLPRLESNGLTGYNITYTQPPSDFNHQGTITYSNQYPLEMKSALTTAFHEGFPGHHLQVSHQVYNSNQLTAIQRLFINFPVYSEGWALYSEHLMMETGIYDDKEPYHLYGKYLGEMLRCCRVVVDIGIHLGLVNLETGRVWDFQQGVDLLCQRCGVDVEEAESEVTRYCGLPGQSICYKLGEKKILEYRERWLQEGGDLYSFHTAFLDLGNVDLAYMDWYFGCTRR